MKTFLDLYRQLEEENYFKRISLSPMAQFGTEDQPMLFARILPDTLVQENAYSEDQIRYAVEPALSGPHYGPAQMQEDGGFVGSLKVELGNNDTSRQMNAATYRSINNLLGQNRDMEATASMLNWVDTQLNRPHAVRAEIERAQAICQGQVIREGTEGYLETVTLYTPTNHRPEVSGGTTASKAGWHSTSYDLYDDIALGVQTLQDKGYQVTDFISTPPILSLMKKNDELAKRSNRVIVNGSGQITSTTGVLTLQSINSVLQDDGWPALTIYNGGYPSRSGFVRYMDSPAGDRDYFVILGRTGLQWDMRTDYTARVEGRVSGYDPELIQQDQLLRNVFGYYAIGKAAGKSSPGRHLHTEMQMRKPMGLYGESYQEGIPVIQVPDALYVIQVLRPTAS